MNLEIAYTIDIQGKGALQFIDQLMCSLYSLKSNKRSEDNINLHLVYGNIPSELMAKLNKLSSEDFRIKYYNLNSQELDRLQKFTRQSPKSQVRSWCGIVYSRLYLSRYLPESVHKVLFIDADTLIRGSLHELYNTELGDNWIGMVIGIVPEYGYNNGIVLYDLDKFRNDTDVWNNLNDHIMKYGKTYFCLDQTVTNRFFEGKIKSLEFKYNYPPVPGQQGTDLKGLSNAIIWHFYNQQVKPIRFDNNGLALVKWNNLFKEVSKLI